MLREIDQDLESHSSSSDEEDGEVEESPLPSLNILTVAEQQEKDAEATAQLLKKEMEGNKLTVLRLLAVAADCTNVNPASVVELQKLKNAAIEEAVEAGDVVYCSNTSYPELGDYCFAFKDEPDLWLPTQIHFFPDITHCFKNAEQKMNLDASRHLTLNTLNLEAAVSLEESKENYLNSIREILVSESVPAAVPAVAAAPGSSQAPGQENTIENDVHKDDKGKKSKDKNDSFVCKGILTFARLAGGNHVIRTRMQQLADLQASERGEPSRRIPKIPGAVAHRFKCRTDIAAVLHPYFQIICKTVEEGDR